ncbi:hypothetical protein NMG60_11019676 [Bertholletia excelsa]
MAQTEDCMRECNPVGEMETVEDVGCGYGKVLGAKAVEVVSPENSAKRRKVNRCCDVESPEKPSSPASLVSRCSSNELAKFSRGGQRSVDQEVESNAENFEAEISTLTSSRFRETTPSTDPYADLDEMQSMTTVKPPAVSLPWKAPEAKKPSAAEIEEFFSVAEKYEQKLFSEKYNYDVVKDVPLEGRYQWVRLRP